MNSIRILTKTDLESVRLEQSEILTSIKNALIDLKSFPESCPRKLKLDAYEGVSYTMVGMTNNPPLLGFKNSYTRWFNQNNSKSKSYATTLMLFDNQTGMPIALMDGGPIGAIRTPAVTALLSAAACTTPPKTLVILGSGVQGHHAAAPMITLWETITKVIFVGTHTSSLDAIAKSTKQLANSLSRKIAVSTTTNAQFAVENADVVIGAAGPASSLKVEINDLKPGATAVVVGHGIEPSVCHQASAIITTSKEQMRLTGIDFCDANGILREPDFELPDLLTGAKTLQRDKDDIVFCYNSGLAVTDIAVAKLISDIASQNNLGCEVSLWN
ncbi:ornithine cyclodeaminase [Corynebacterium propinquum]